MTCTSQEIVRLADRTGFRVLLPTYPLAPENSWPSQLHTALDVVGSVTGPVVLADASAGGHLALVAALQLRRRGKHLAGLVLLSPNTVSYALSGRAMLAAR